MKRTLIRVAVSYVVASFVAWMIFPLSFESHGAQRATILVSLVFPVITLSALFEGEIDTKMWSFLGVFLLVFLPLAWISLTRRSGNGQTHRESREKPRGVK